MSSKVCKNCQKTFYKKAGRSPSAWNKQENCSLECGSQSRAKCVSKELKNGAVMSHQEVADKLGCTPQNIRKIEKRAFAKLRIKRQYGELLSLIF